MRTLCKNQQKMYYSLLIGEVPIYELDEDGNPKIAYTDDEGNVYYEETGETELKYSEPVSFFGNITMSGGESETAEYGLNLADYSAVLIVDKDTLPISETSLIWHTSEPVYKGNGDIDGFTADYNVVKINPSLSADKYILKKTVK